MRILLASDEATVDRAFHDTMYLVGLQKRFRRSSRPLTVDERNGTAMAKAALVSQWENHPLKTSRHVKEWAGMMTTSCSTASAGIDPIQVVSGENDTTETTGRTLHNSAMEVKEGRTVNNVTSASGLRHTNAPIPASIPQPQATRSQTESGHASISKGAASQNIALPVDFQRQFLW